MFEARAQAQSDPPRARAAGGKLKHPRGRAHPHFKGNYSQSFRQSRCWFNPGRPDWPDGPPAVVLMLRTEEEGEEAIGQKRSPLEPNRKQTDMKSNGSERMKRVLVHHEEEEE